METTMQIVLWTCGKFLSPRITYNSMIGIVTIVPDLIIVNPSKKRNRVQNPLLRNLASWCLGPICRSYYCQPIQKEKPRPKPAPPKPRLLVPWTNLQTGLLMRAFYFKQGSRCPNLKGRRANLVKRVTTVNYPTTNKAWPSFTKKDNFAVRWDGILKVSDFSKPYTFYIGSDDGSKLYINGGLKVNND